MIFRELEIIKIKGRFRFYPYLVCGVDRKIYQLPHCKTRRTLNFREVKYNDRRKGYQINGVWVAKSRLLNEQNYYECIEDVVIS